MNLVAPGMGYGAAELPEAEYINPTLSQILMAQLNTENSVGLVLNSLSEHWEPLRQTFYGDIDPRLKEVEFNINSIENTHYAPYAKDFLDVKTEAEAIAKKQRIDRELEYRQIIASGSIGQNLIASLAAGLVDPISWISMGSLSLPGMAARYGSKLLAGQAARTALVAGAGAAQQTLATEAIAQGLSYTRTMEESLINIGSSALLGGLIGGGASQATITLRSAWRNKAASKFEQDMTDIATGDLLNPQISAKRADALEVEGGSIPPQEKTHSQKEIGAQTKMIGNYPGWRAAAATKALAWFGKVTPGNRLAFSPSKSVHEATQKLITLGYNIDSNFNYNAAPSTVHAVATHTKMVARDQLGTYLLDTQKKLRAAGYRYSKDRLSQEMYEVYTRSATAPEGKKVIFDHPISIVNEGLDTIHRNILDPYKEKGIKSGVFSKNIRTKYANQHLPRIWNRDAIKKDRPLFEELMKRGYMAERETLTSKVRALEETISTETAARKEGAKGKPPAEKYQKKLERLKKLIRTDEEIGSDIREVLDNMMYGINGNIEHPVSRNDRHRRIPIENADAIPFLVTDFEMACNMTIERMSTDIALEERFGAHVSFFDTKAYKEITDEFKQLREANPVDSDKLGKEYFKNVNDLVAIWDLMRGKFGKTTYTTADDWFKRGVRLARGYGVITKLGAMSFSSIADLAMGIHHVGIKRFMGTALTGLLRTEGWSLAREEAKALGFIFDVTLNNTLPRDLLSLTEQANMHALPERMMRRGQNFVVKWSGASWLETIKSRLNTMLIQQDIFKTSQAIVNGTANHNQKTFLASIGINADIAAQFVESQKKHGSVRDNYHLGGFDKWDSKLRERFINSLSTGVEKISLNPQVWEKPLFLSTLSGSLIGQWMGWAFTAYDKIVVAGLQRGDANTIFGILTSVGLAAISEKLREIWTGTREDRRMKDDQILTNSIIRSGVIGHAGVMLERMSAIAGGRPAYYLAGRTVDNTRVASAERAAIQIMGPTAGMLVDALSAGTLLFEEGRNERNVRSLTKLMPFRNLMPFRIMWDAAEEGLKDALVE